MKLLMDKKYFIIFYIDIVCYGYMYCECIFYLGNFLFIWNEILV